MATLDTCDCCEPAEDPTPEEIYNRHGLSAIQYRIGTYGSFLQTMLDSIAREPALRVWSTRSEDDYGILVLSMWAYVADILTFYQERIANEAFLRTAVHWESVLQLVEMLDYEPAPGLAATTMLAFTTEKDAQVQIPVGLRVQSVPGQDEKPQKFETVETLLADAALNKSRVYGVPQEREPLEAESPYGILDPDKAEALADELAEGQSLIVFATGTVQETTVTAVEEEDWRTVLRWAPAVPTGMPSGAKMYRWQRKLRLFGRNAPDKQLHSILNETTQIFTWAEVDLDLEIPSGTSVFDLETVVDDLEAGTVVLVVTPSFVKAATISAVEQVHATIKDTTNTFTVLSDTVTQITLSRLLPKIDDLREAVIYTLVGEEIVFWPYAYPDVLQGDTLYLRLDELGTSLFDAEAILDPTTFLKTLQDAHKRDADGEPLEEGDALALYLLGQFSSALETEIAGYDTSAPPSETLLKSVVDGLNSILKTDTALYDADRYAHVELDEALRDIALDAATLNRTEDPRLIRLNRLLLEAAFPDEILQTSVLENLEADRRLLLTDKQGLPEEATVDRVEPLDIITDGRHVVIEVSAALKRSLRGDEATLYGNVVKATHGETVSNEALGSGDAADTFQAFTLKKSPVTFVPDAEASHGAGNTLEVRVGGIKWKEEETLYGQDPKAEIYTTRLDDEDNMIVQFGDGRTGAWLPTGRNNVTAAYRKGLGPDGNVAANALKNLLDKPKGLKAAINPDQARGGAAGEDTDEARENAPNSVRIFDRIVSLRDFEDAARAYAGIAKARADLQWDGEQRVVELIVAGDDGARVEQQVKTNLVSYLDARRDPNRTMRVVPHRTVPVRIAVAVQVNDRYEDETVEAAVRAALEAYLAFDNRDLGQPVHLSDVYQVAHDVEGVVAADVNELHYKRIVDKNSHGVTAEAVQEHLPMLPKELAAITTPGNDITVTIGLES